jgi:DNA-binding XRE family transcriptional regulator
METLNANFKKLRNQRKITQDGFAKVLSTTRANIGAYEENRAAVPLHIVRRLIELSFIKKSELYSFLFENDYTSI